jgi:methionine sulfoxide reductase heme-binding subunit
MQALWYASRATGLVSLLLFTAVVVLGALHGGRFAAARWPRFAVAGLHRNLSLLALVFLAVHVSTAVLDPYAGLAWLDVLVPGVSTYLPLWTGLGAVALDLVLALVGTSLLRPRISVRTWRLVHWTAYLAWPVAIGHGLGSGGADSRTGWVDAVTAGCVLAGLLAVGWRSTVRHPDTEARRSWARVR